MKNIERSYLESPVFILGHPKSGTSLITALLDSHPQLMVLPEESDFYSLIDPLISQLNANTSLSVEDRKSILINKICNGTQLRNLFRGKVEEDISGNFDYSDFNTPLFRNLIIDSLNQDFINSKELIKGIINAYAASVYSNMQIGHFKYWVEKTPKHIYSLQTIKNQFPCSKFIFIYRDPRDNYVSYQKKQVKPLTAFDFVSSWNKCFEIAESIDKQRILFIKYEELVLDPKKQIERLTSFLEIERTEVLFQPTKKGLLWKGNSMFQEKKEAIDASKLYRFRSIIQNEDLSVIEFLCRSNMRRYRYETDVQVSFEKKLMVYCYRVIGNKKQFFGRCRKKMRCYLMELKKYFVYTTNRSFWSK